MLTNNAVVAAFNQEKALVGAFSVITNLRICFGWNFLKHYSLCSTWPVLPVTARTRVSALKAMLVTAYGSSPSSLGAGPVTLRSLLRSNSFPVLRQTEIFLITGNICRGTDKTCPHLVRARCFMEV